MLVHLIKLVVGPKTLEEFAAEQPGLLMRYKDGLANPVWTRHQPKRADELLNGGSMYRVMKNKIRFRQRIIGFESVAHPEKGSMCLIMCDPKIIRVASTPKRPFQGWRYFKPENVPRDLGPYSQEDSDDWSPNMQNELARLGLL